MRLTYIEPIASLTIGLSLRETIMTGDEIADCYRSYIACLNGRRWAELERFVHDEVHYNGQFVGLDGWQERGLYRKRVLRVQYGKDQECLVGYR